MADRQMEAVWKYDFSISKLNDGQSWRHFWTAIQESNQINLPIWFVSEKLIP